MTFPKLPLLPLIVVAITFASAAPTALPSQFLDRTALMPAPRAVGLEGVRPLESYADQGIIEDRQQGTLDNITSSDPSPGGKSKGALAEVVKATAAALKAVLRTLNEVKYRDLSDKKNQQAVRQALAHALASILASILAVGKTVVDEGGR